MGRVLCVVGPLVNDVHCVLAVFWAMESNTLVIDFGKNCMGYCPEISAQVEGGRASRGTMES